MTLRITAPAKLNFFLHVTGKRPDGYHLLESLAGFTEFGDVIEMEEAEGLALRIEGPFAAELADDLDNNLVLRAAHKLQHQLGTRKGARITLHKHIPMGAGLGGGSSDAAATLKGLLQLWQVSVSETELLLMALSLGADVPVCMAAQTAWFGGIGEHVLPVERKGEGYVVLVNPKQPLLTKDVFRHFPGVYTPPLAPVATIGSFADLVKLMLESRNDLEAPAIELMPVIAEILDLLRATKDCSIARMSGSGATCFALFENRAVAESAARELAAAHPLWWVQATALAR